VPITQPAQENPLPSAVIASSEAPAEALEPPHRRRPSVGNMTIIFWMLLLAFGILILLVRGPLHAPPFDSLTQYLCDPVPSLAVSRLGNRLQSYPLNIKCRAGDQVIFQRQAVVDGSNPAGLKACRQEEGLTRIWRMEPPSAYGGYVFHSTCGDHITMYYKNRAASYESTQVFAIAVACILILFSLTYLIRFLFHSHRRHRSAST
jgi:hypothetical protein